MLALTQHVLATAMRDWSLFASVGLPIRFSINVPIIALAKLPLAAIIAQHRPKASNWPGLVLEISEDEIMQDLTLAQKVGARAAPARHQRSRSTISAAPIRRSRR